MTEQTKGDEMEPGVLILLKRFPADLRREIKIAAAERDMTMRDFIIEACRQAVKRQRQRRKG